MYRYFVDSQLYYRFIALGIGSTVLYRIWPVNLSSLFDFFVQKKFDSRLWYIGIGSDVLYRIWPENVSSLFDFFFVQKKFCLVKNKHLLLLL